MICVFLFFLKKSLTISYSQNASKRITLLLQEYKSKQSLKCYLRWNAQSTLAQIKFRPDATKRLASNASNIANNLVFNGTGVKIS